MIDIASGVMAIVGGGIVAALLSYAFSLEFGIWREICLAAAFALVVLDGTCIMVNGLYRKNKDASKKIEDAVLINEKLADERNALLNKSERLESENNELKKINATIESNRDAIRQRFDAVKEENQDLKLANATKTMELLVLKSANGHDVNMLEVSKK